MTRLGTWALAALALGAAVAPAEADADPCGVSGLLSGASVLTCTYSTVGSDVFTVPAGVSAADFTVVGASGGHYFIDGDAAHPDPGGALTGRPGGAGGETTATLDDLTPGAVLEVDVAGRGGNGTAPNRSGGMANGPTGGAGAPGGVGGSGGDASGAPGGSTVTPGGNGGNGSGGGGASDVRFAPGGCAAALTCPLSAVLLVAAGGGGGGGTGGQGNAIGGAGGAGGGSSGSDGGSTIDGGNAGTWGLGATSSAGGAGGLEPGRHASGAEASDPRYGGDGAAGSQGAGGVGGAGNTPCTAAQMLTPPCTGGPMSGGGTSGGGAGGGGGGGWFGGGGGSGGGGLYGGYGGAGGGGGGGSGFAVAAAVDPVLTGGVNCDPTPSVPCAPTINGGDGQVTISWAAPGSIATTTTLAAAPASPVTNQTLTLTATVTPDSGAADGVVEFDNHHAAIGACAAVPVAAGGTAVCSFVVSAAGSPYGLNAIFVPAPETVQVASTSANQRVVVGLDPTTTALSVPGPVVAAGALVTYTATVVPADPGVLAPTGTVQFADGGTAIPACASQPLSGAGTGTCAVSYADGGSHAITASYQADTNFAASVSASAAVTALPPLPVNAAVPTISGAAAVGGTLTEAHGAWTGSPTSFTYQWQDCSAAGDACTAIAGATGQTYMPVAADAGHTLRVAESATNVTGTGGPAASAPTPVVVAPAPPPPGPTPPANSGLPVLAGSPALGRGLTCSPGSWAGTTPQTYAFQWLRDGTPIAGALGASYTVVGADAGHALACRVTAANAAGSAVATSVAVRVAAAAPALGTAKAAAARVRGTRVSLAVSCAGAAGQTCTVAVTLSVLETVRGGRVTAVTASTRRVTLGTKQVTLGAGRHATVSVELNATGRHLLATRHRLGVRLVAVARASGGRTTTLRTQTLTFKA